MHEYDGLAAHSALPLCILHRADIVVPLCRPQVRILVGDLLPSLGSGMEKR
jgi:hypothetical protein